MTLKVPPPRLCLGLRDPYADRASPPVLLAERIDSVGLPFFHRDGL